MDKVPKINKTIHSSFRDPSGFVFSTDGIVYRQVNKTYRHHYNRLMESGLYEALVRKGLLIKHEEVALSFARSDEVYKVLKPLQLDFISYPYEWCFSQLKDAALVTLEVQKNALDFGMTVKDASAYNIQFIKGRPVFIDTLSFEEQRKGQPWVAYRQFCQHFLAPLALMSFSDVRLNQLLRIYVDGIPLDLASKLLPFRTRFTFSLLAHIHLHAKSQQRFSNTGANTKNRKISHLALVSLISSIRTAVNKLTWSPKGTEWAKYYEQTNYSSQAMDYKKQLVDEFLEKISPSVVWDIGANTGLFSRIAAKRGILTISFDIDVAAVEKNYLECLKEQQTNVLPLLLDLTNPSPGIGWQNEERDSFINRGPVDTVLALALIHHLAISNNLPLNRIADFFDRICHTLIIEFVPKSDSQVQRLLATREDIFGHYHKDAFEKVFSKHFTIQKAADIRGTERTLYLMVRK